MKFQTSPVRTTLDQSVTLEAREFGVAPRHVVLLQFHDASEEQREVVKDFQAVIAQITAFVNKYADSAYHPAWLTMKLADACDFYQANSEIPRSHVIDHAGVAALPGPEGDQAT